MLPRNFEDKYHSRPHPLLMKCEARAISRDPVLMRAIELRLYARLVSSAWWRRRLDHAVLFKSFISVTHCPSQRNWWIVQIYGIPMPEQVGIFFRGFARLMKVSPSGSSLVIRLGLVWYFPDMSGWTSGPIFSGEVRFFPDIDRGTSGGGFENYAEPKTQVFRCF